ncbi:MAG: C-type lectin domain-containing protein, partial [Nitrospira sp.]|nr:C-type lectin domain-containing protein [Nitrospira sp.]
NSAANSLDLLKLTGITFEPVVTAGTKTMRVVVTHTYNAGGGNPAGNYSWGYGMAGYLDPPSNENIVGDQLQQSGEGTFASPPVRLGLGLDTGKLATPSTNNLNASVTRSRAAVVVMPACNTGSNRCAPTITQTFTLTVVGKDKLVLSDSLIAAGGTCQAITQAIPIPPGLYKKMLKLDPHAPNDVNKLSEWLATNSPLLKIEQGLKAQLHRLRKGVGPRTCPEVEATIDEIVEDDVQAELVAVAAAGPFEIASPGGTITITKNTSQETSETFTFRISNGESSSSETIEMGGQTSQSIVVTVEPGTYGLEEINIPEGWSLTSSSCGIEGSTTEVVVEVDDNVNCTFNNKTFNSDDYRVINLPGVTWSGARTHIQQTLGSGWDLATIRSQEEQEFIQGLLPPNPREIPGTHDYWIAGEQPSGSAEPGGTWRWATDGFVFYNNGATPNGYANWGTASTGPVQGPDNEPNNLGGNENHTTLDNRYGWGWNDLNWKRRNSRLCCQETFPGGSVEGLHSAAALMMRTQ